jgi:hypothetical protein
VSTLLVVEFHAVADDDFLQRGSIICACATTGAGNAAKAARTIEIIQRFAVDLAITPLDTAMCRAKAIFAVLLFLSAALLAQYGLKSSPASKPHIMVLGVFHLVSTTNMFTQKQGDTLTPKRQREIEEVVERLKAFHPTKIAVEHHDAKLNERYQPYLAGKYVLTGDETDQYAFRLGKELGLSRIDSVYYPVSFEPKKAEAYANAHEQKAMWDAALDRANKLVEQLNDVLERGTMLDGTFQGEIRE